MIHESLLRRRALDVATKHKATTVIAAFGSSGLGGRSFASFTR
jgi:hypothetical protein